jgi:hypothetical protein
MANRQISNTLGFLQAKKEIGLKGTPSFEVLQELEHSQLPDTV